MIYKDSLTTSGEKKNLWKVITKNSSKSPEPLHGKLRLMGQSHLSAMPVILWGYTKQLQDEDKRGANIGTSRYSQLNCVEQAKASNMKCKALAEQSTGTRAAMCLSEAGPKPNLPLLLPEIHSAVALVHLAVASRWHVTILVHPGCRTLQLKISFH